MPSDLAKQCTALQGSQDEDNCRRRNQCGGQKTNECIRVPMPGTNGQIKPTNKWIQMPTILFPLVDSFSRLLLLVQPVKRSLRSRNPNSLRLSQTACSGHLRRSMLRFSQRVAGAVRSRSFGTESGAKDAVIVSFARTPIGKFLGGLSSLPGPELGAQAIKAALSRCGDHADVAALVEEAYMGNVISAGIGQAPARQAVIRAGLAETVACTTVNKVCASGMKAVALAAQSVWLGQREVVLAGGFESMSNVPYYLPKARAGYRIGNGEVVDGVIKDGLWDAKHDMHMGMCAEACAETFGFSREAQDDYAVESYRRAAAAWGAGKFDAEVAPVSVPQRRGDPIVVTRDEEFINIDLKKLRTLRPAFKPEGGTVTAANASTLNDGAAALVVMSAARAAALGLTPLARIRGVADAERAHVEFTVAPADAIPLALKHAGVEKADVGYWEINEAFSVVALANAKLLSLDPARLNVNGGGVALGHPIGMSGARLVGSIIHVLRQNDSDVGCAAICNGGGGASAIVIERLS